MITATCTHDPDASARPDSTDPNDPHAISIDEALDNLQSVLSVIIDGGTRTTSEHRIQEVRTYRNHIAQEGTRSETPSEGNLIHVVNYADNAGFAVLSADRRLPSDVLAVTESGNINMWVLDSICNARPRFPMIDRKDSLPYDPYLPDPIYDGIADLIINPDLHLNTGSQYFYSDQAMYDYGPWEDVKKVFPLIHSKWDQSEPYNYFAVKYERGPYAGCGPVALAQFLAYFQLERNVSLPKVNNKTMDWQAIKKTFTGNTKISKFSPINTDNVTYADWIAVSDLIYQCGELLHVTYHSDRTSCDMYDMSNVFNNMNFITDFGRVDFTPEIAYLMIVTRNLPVIIREQKHNHHTKGHMWVLDGWLKQSRNIRELYQGKVTNRLQMRDLIHCNWGWGGIGDGYFYPGHFRVSDREGKEPGYGDSYYIPKDDKYYASEPKLFTYQLR